MWLEIIEGLLRLMFLHAWPAVVFWEKNGIPFEIAFFVLISYWTFWLILIYYKLNNWLIKLSRKWRPLEIFITTTKRETDKMIKNIPRWKFQKKLINWLVSKGKTITLILTFVPWIIILPTATIIAARLMKIPRAFPVLLAGGIFRAFILCLTVFYGFSALL